jgi:hypothetical protein
VCKKKRTGAGKKSFFGRRSAIGMIVIDEEEVEDMHSGNIRRAQSVALHHDCRRDAS